MLRALRASLFVAVFLIQPGLVLAQATPGKAIESSKPGEPAKPKLTLDKIKVPPGGVVVVVEEVKEALALFPKMILMAPEEYQKLQERLAFLEKQLKSEKKTAHACKLTGRLEGDFVVLRAEFAFTTEQPDTAVFLGLLGAHLTDEGELDRRVPLLEFGDEGLFVKVEKEGTHQLALNLKAPVSFKRSVATTPVGSGERSFDLGLPGAAVTTLALDLPSGVKEVRWNDTLEKPRGPNHWELALGKIKTLTVSWKEMVSLPGKAPMLTADSQINIKLDENQILLNADITLEDLRGQTKEWQLLLPHNGKVDVKAPSGLSFDLLYPDGNRPYHIIRLAEPSAERVLVNVEVRYPRPFPEPRLPIGPFFALGTFRQEGIIIVNAPPETLHGQRLVFHRFGDIYPRDIPKGSADVAAIFKFWNVPGLDRPPQGSPSKTSLELELQSAKSLADASVDHYLQVKPTARGWLIDVTTSIQMKSKPDFLDIQLPRLQVPRFGLLGVSPGAPFPAAVPWLPIAPRSDKNIAQAVPLSFTCEEDGLKLASPDALRKARLAWNRFSGNELKLIGKYLVPEGVDRVRIDLPRPVDVLDRGGKVRIKANEQLELFVGAAGSEGPALEKHEAQLTWDTFPENVEIAWKPYRPEFRVAGLTDIWLHNRGAEVKQQLSFTVPARAARTGSSQSAQLRLRVPRGVTELAVVSGGKLITHDPGNETAWILPSAEPLTRTEIQLRYDFSLPEKVGQVPASFKRVVQVPLVWPEEATRQDAKVRVWSEAGTNPLLVEPLHTQETWRDHGIEFVPGSEVLPALVLRGTGLNLPLALRLVEATSARLPALVCDRGLVQVTIDEEGNHRYRVRYWVQKLNARRLDVEFPMPAAHCLLNVWLDKKKINNWELLEPMPNVAQIPVQPRLYHQPIVLEIEYKLPASFTASKRFWRTTLYAPQFRGEEFLGRIRWQVSLPFSWFGLVPGGKLDYHWGIQGWLLAPEPTLTSDDQEYWPEANDTPAHVRLAFSRTGQESVQLLHLGRQLWLLLCSGVLLAIGLALFVLPFTRRTSWLVVAGLGSGALAVGLLWPGWMPALVFGCQPGVLVLIVLLGIQWMLQENYRRKLVFMPGFNRLKANSSLIRSGSSGNRRDASTIDAPTSGTSSVAPSSQGSK